jgi:hypothetical protein
MTRVRKEAGSKKYINMEHDSNKPHTCSEVASKRIPNSDRPTVIAVYDHAMSTVVS